MGCELQNLSFTDKVKIVYENLADNGFSFSSSDWDGNLATSDNTLQKIFNKFDDFGIGSINADVILPTVADLEAYTEIKNYVKVEGFWEVGDTLMPLYKYVQNSTKATIVGTVIAHSSGTGNWEMMLPDRVNIMWLGARRAGSGVFRGNFLDTTALDAITTQKVGDYAFVGSINYLHDGTSWSIATNTDSIIAINTALKNYNNVYAPSGIFHISDTIVQGGEGSIFLGAGKQNTFFVNLTTSKRIFDVGDIYQNDMYAHGSTAGMFTMVGNAGTEAGITQWADDSVLDYKNEKPDSAVATWTGACRNVNWFGIGARTIGGGSAFRTYAWSSEFRNLSCYKYPGETVLTRRGLETGQECNANSYDTIYISHTAEEGYFSIGDGSHGATTSCTFNNLIMQYCGRESNTITMDIKRHWNCKFQNVYIEPYNHGAENTEPIIVLDGSCGAVTMDSIYCIYVGVTIKHLIVNNSPEFECRNIYTTINVPEFLIKTSGYDKVTKAYSSTSSTATTTVRGNILNKGTVPAILDFNNRAGTIERPDSLHIESNASDGSNNITLRSYKPTIVLDDKANIANLIHIYNDGGRVSLQSVATGQKLLDIVVANGAFASPIRHSIYATTNTVNFRLGNLLKLTATAGILGKDVMTGTSGQKGQLIISSAENLTGFDPSYVLENGVDPTLTGKCILDYTIQTESVILITNIMHNAG